MLNSLHLFRKGSTFFGLALVVALCAMMPAKADFSRFESIGDIPWEDSSLVYEWLYDGTSGGGKYIGGGGGRHDYWGGNYITAAMTYTSVTLSGGDVMWKALANYALVFSSDSIDFTRMTVTGNLWGKDTGEITVEGSGNYFSGFKMLDLLVEHGDGDKNSNWSLTFTFENKNNSAYALYLLEEWKTGSTKFDIAANVKTYYASSDPDGAGNGTGTDIPEPATLAIFGLGLVGLGLTRFRRK